MGGGKGFVVRGIQYLLKNHIPSPVSSPAGFEWPLGKSGVLRYLLVLYGEFEIWGLWGFRAT